jgi:hypothetical protein
MTQPSDPADRLYLRTSPLDLQARVIELRRRQARLRELIEAYLEAVGTPLLPGAFEDHTELLATLGEGPVHLAAQRAAIAMEIAVLVQGLHTAIRDATPIDEANLATHRNSVYVLTQASPRAVAALDDIRSLLQRWASRWSQYQSAASGPPA